MITLEGAMTELRCVDASRMKLYNSKNELVRDIQLCIRKEDNAIGWYDHIKEKFYPDVSYVWKDGEVVFLGTGLFFPTKQELQYIETRQDLQYINTNIEVKKEN